MCVIVNIVSIWYFGQFKKLNIVISLSIDNFFVNLCQWLNHTSENGILVSSSILSYPLPVSFQALFSASHEAIQGVCPLQAGWHLIVPSNLPLLWLYRTLGNIEVNLTNWFSPLTYPRQTVVSSIASLTDVGLVASWISCQSLFILFLEEWIV